MNIPYSIYIQYHAKSYIIINNIYIYIYTSSNIKYLIIDIPYNSLSIYHKYFINSQYSNNISIHIYIYINTYVLYISRYPIAHDWFCQGPVSIGLCWTAGRDKKMPGPSQKRTWKIQFGMENQSLLGGFKYLLCFNYGNIKHTLW